ncbi:MAG: hypothetical protein KAT65_21815, partial [Methanophagales archaeon]|nr:hypothetical protein [Methanophagales archaeon]
MEETTYSAKDIQVLKDLTAVQKRPAMYIGDTTSRGLHHLVNEAIDNSVDEALIGFCDTIDVIIHEDNSITVRDNGRGIPVDTHVEYNLSGVEVVMTKLHAGGKFDDKVYKVAGGLHGVGISVVNALSTWLEVEVVREGRRYYQRYEHGKPTCELKELIGLDAEGDGYAQGTKVTFKPDDTIFSVHEFDAHILATRVRELAFLNPGLSLLLKDERSGESKTFKYDGGLVSFLEYINRNKHVLHKAITFEADKDDVKVGLGLQYNDSY